MGLLGLFLSLGSEVFKSGNENSVMTLLERGVYSSFLISESLSYKANEHKSCQKMVEYC